MMKRIGAFWIVLLVPAGVAAAAGTGPKDAAAAKALIKALLARPAAQPARIRSLIKDLGHDDWRVRERATRALIALGSAAEPFVEAATRSPDPEVAERAAFILRAHQTGPDGERDQLARAIDVLLAARDKWLVGALIRLLGHRRLVVRYPAEYALRRATGQCFGYSAYAAPAGRAAAAGKWRAWWKKAEAAFAFDARRAAAAKPTGFLICGNGTPKVWLVDAAGKVVWTKKTRNKTYCAVGLPNGNTIISDYGAGIIEEYDPAGKVVWNTEGIPLPGSVHGIERLGNGNTLIAHTDGQRVIEVDPRGKIVWTYRDEGHPASAQRLANGTKLPNGNVLIADYGKRRVIEVDCTGRIVWERKCRSGPNSARRLRDGRTVIAAGSEGIVLVDADGRLVRTLYRAGNPGKVSIAPAVLPRERKRSRRADRGGRDPR